MARSSTSWRCLRLLLRGSRTAWEIEIVCQLVKEHILTSVNTVLYVSWERWSTCTCHGGLERGVIPKVVSVSCTPPVVVTMTLVGVIPEVMSVSCTPPVVVTMTLVGVIPEVMSVSCTPPVVATMSLVSPVKGVAALPAAIRGERCREGRGGCRNIAGF